MITALKILALLFGLAIFACGAVFAIVLIARVIRVMREGK